MTDLLNYGSLENMGCVYVGLGAGHTLIVYQYLTVYFMHYFTGLNIQTSQLYL